MKLLNKTQSKRSILSKCGIDKQMFLSNVYKKRTQAKKHQLDVPQFGRSMVEMLGVLAIIGVLSVGGIAGYSKAMMKHKINKSIEQFSIITQNVRTVCHGGKCNDQLACEITGDPESIGCKSIKNLALAPDEMWRNSSYVPENIFGSSLSFDAYNDEIFIFSGGMPDDACVTIATADWTSSVSGIKFAGVMQDVYGYSQEYAAKHDISVDNDSSFYLPLPVNTVATLCDETGGGMTFIIDSNM